MSGLLLGCFSLRTQAEIGPYDSADGGVGPLPATLAGTMFVSNSAAVEMMESSKQEIRCPNCGQRLNVPLRYTGSVGCPACKEKIPVEGGNSWDCPRCKNTSFTKDTISVAGTGLTKMLDLQNRRFKVISCDKCGYSELYREVQGMGANILDFLT